MHLVVHEVMELEHVNVADRRLLLHRLAGAAVDTLLRSSSPRFIECSTRSRSSTAASTAGHIVRKAFSTDALRSGLRMSSESIRNLAACSATYLCSWSRTR